MVVILMVHQHLTLQEALDQAASLVQNTFKVFCENLTRIPSFASPELDHDAAAYVVGLQDWVVGSINWSFSSERYFGKKAAYVKEHRVLELLPKKKRAA